MPVTRACVATIGAILARGEPSLRRSEIEIVLRYFGIHEVHFAGSVRQRQELVSRLALAGSTRSQITRRSGSAFHTMLALEESAPPSGGAATPIIRLAGADRGARGGSRGGTGGGGSDARPSPTRRGGGGAVSYTHLTLP